MPSSTAKAQTNRNYTVKNVETVVAGIDVQARVFTLAPSEVIPWHSHSESTDYYFVLRGTLTIETRDPDDRLTLDAGDRHQLPPGIVHSILNGEARDCEFLLLQGTGKYDFLKAEG